MQLSHVFVVGEGAGEGKQRIRRHEVGQGIVVL